MQNNKLTIFLIFVFIISSCSPKQEKQQIEKYNNTIDSLQNLIYCQEEELNRLYALVDSLPLGPPLDTLITSSRYGWRKSPLSGRWQMHSGVDYMAAWYDTVYSTGDGIVVKSSWNLGYGRQIKVEHLLGYQSSYSHLYKLFVKKGDSVELGQAIGRAGNSGMVTGPHLHYEVIRNNIKTNPIPYIRNLK